MKATLFCWLVLLSKLTLAQSSGPNYRYTLYMKLHSIKADKVVEAPFDNEEDLYGQLYGTAEGEGVEGTSGGQRVNIISVSKELRDFHVGRSDEPLDIERLVGRRLTLDEVGNLKIRIGGELQDKELAAYFPYKMTNANEISQGMHHEYRGFYLKDIASFMNALRAMPPSPIVQAVKFGKDTLAEAEFREATHPANVNQPESQRSQITVYWQFRVIVSTN